MLMKNGMILKGQRHQKHKIGFEKYNGEGHRKAEECLHMCFVVFVKTFDTVKRDMLVETLGKFGIDGSDIRIIIKLYWEQRAMVRVDDDRKSWVNNV